MAMCHDMAASDFIIPPDCRITVSLLSGRPVFSGKTKDTVSFKLYSQLLLRAVQKSESRDLSVSLEVVQTTSQIKWQLINAESCTGLFIMRPITEKEHEIIDCEMEASSFDHCFICLSGCEDADDIRARSRNCMRCLPSFLCPNCKVFVSGNPVCYACLEPDDHARLTTELSDVCRSRMSLLGFDHQEFGYESIHCDLHDFED